LDRLQGLSLRDHEKYVSLTMEFRCNLKCVHCMIEDTMDRLAPTSDATLDNVCRDQQETGRWEGLVLTGSEITLRRDLPDIARKAKASGFKHVRIQTHGMHLGRTDYADKLVDAGVDEYFVSVAGSDRESHDRITQVTGAWDKMMRGMEHLDQYDHVKLITNSVITTQSYQLLPGMVDALSHLKRLVQMEFWNFFPMAPDDPKDLLANNSDILPYLRDAVLKCRDQGRYTEVKNFPECMLADLGDALVNAQPMLMIDPDFWVEFDKNGFYQCPHQATCASTECLGLTTAYLGKFGDDADRLSPLV
ncbi:radical SAM protein, partial [Yoonia sp.]|nr:radical SAM protein [Yoonia sp.]